ncbi:MAG: DUF4959 domain-containing protein [Bacteroidales bacterium]|jgi:hypothetical protein|nr:DUF4959 domain-containing protein [Bacteroidales bacterium]
MKQIPDTANNRKRSTTILTACCAPLLLAFAMMLASCEEIDKGVPVPDDVTPAEVSDVNATGIPGGATITYTLPKNSNIMYVVAEYELEDGILHNKKASVYSNSITVEGFADTKTRNITLYSVSHSGKKSAPKTVEITPQTPPYSATYNSLEIEATFGGAKVNFANESKADLKLIVLTTDSVGDYYQVYTYYTKAPEGQFSIRGFSTDERTFAVYTLDRWSNKSDTLFVAVTPWYEQQLDRLKFAAVHLPSDTYEPHMSDSYRLETVWDGVWGSTAAFHTKPNTPIPQWFTLDLGVTARLSRMKLWHRLAASSGTGSDGQYSNGAPKLIEIYGSNAPPIDGSWENWQLLGRFDSYKPSGDARWTDEDIQYACYDGEDFEFTDNSPVKYVRVKLLQNWGGVTYMYLSEIAFWGDIETE